MVAGAAEHHDGQVDVAAVAVDTLHEVAAIGVGDADVQQHHVDGVGLEGRQHGRTVGPDHRVIARLLEHGGDDALTHHVAVGHQDACAAQVKGGGRLPDYGCARRHREGIHHDDRLRLPARGPTGRLRGVR